MVAINKCVMGGQAWVSGLGSGAGVVTSVFKYAVVHARWPPITSLGFWRYPSGGGEGTTVGVKSVTCSMGNKVRVTVNVVGNIIPLLTVLQGAGVIVGLAVAVVCCAFASAQEGRGWQRRQRRMGEGHLVGLAPASKVLDTRVSANVSDMHARSVGQPVTFYICVPPLPVAADLCV